MTTHQPSTPARFDVVGIGNALVDVLSSEPDDFLAGHGLVKGSMTLIDTDTAEALYGAMGAKTEAFYHAIADLCQTAGVQLVLYPHAGCSIESAEEALVMRNRLAALGEIPPE